MSKKKESAGKDIENEGGETMLPTYGDTTEPTKPPPSYDDSLKGKIKAARSDSSNVCQFLIKFIFILSGTVCCVFFGFVTLGLPITMIVIGAMYLNQCPLEPKIPIYLVVFGAFGGWINLFSAVSPLTMRCKKNGEDQQEGCCCKALKGLNGLITLFLFCWFICGNVWVYGNVGIVDKHNATSTNYCNELVYEFTFWTISLTYILVGLGFVCCCTACIVFCACASRK